MAVVLDNNDFERVDDFDGRQPSFQYSTTVLFFIAGVGMHGLIELSLLCFKS